MKEKKLFECKTPCGNCPYRKDAPLHHWVKEEFLDLLAKEESQLGAVYKCHKNHGGACVGWLMAQRENGLPSIALQLALINYQPPQSYIESLSSPAEMFSGVKEMARANYPRIFRK